MIASHQRLGVAVLFAILASVACATRTPLDFRVVPAAPSYLLHSPDSSETPFPDVLRAYNGFERGRAWNDLRPGMELRIENAYYRPGMPRRGLDGFLGTEIARYKVAALGRLKLISVEPMKDRPEGETPVQQLISPQQQRHEYYRFYYEILFRRSGSSRGSVLLGADSTDEINRLAAQLMNDPDSVCSQTSTNCTVFPDACSVSIESEIVVNGVLRNVVWGGVLANVVDHPHHIAVLRTYKGRLVPVRLNDNDPQALRLPLLPGDHVQWN